MILIFDLHIWTLRIKVAGKRSPWWKKNDQTPIRKKIVLIQKIYFIISWSFIQSFFVRSLYLASSGLDPQANGVNDTNENINHRQLDLAVVLVNLTIKICPWE